MLTIAHAAQVASFQRAVEAKIDVITHTPMDKVLDSHIIEAMLAQRTIAVPALTMMESIMNTISPPGASFVHAADSVTAMYRAGIPILAGTDANSTPRVPVQVKHGESLHRELELLVDAGLSNLDALRSCTSLPARLFGFGDRGVIALGKRADLLLLKDDPMQDIKATRSIQRVWCKGVESDRSGESSVHQE